MRIIFLLLCMILAFGYGHHQQRSIKIQSIAEKAIEPDKVELTIAFNEIENIKKENELKIKEAKLKELIKNFSIDITNLTVDNLAARRYGYYKSSSKRISMSKVYKLQTDNIAIIDSLTVKLFEIGANDVSVTNLQSKQLEVMKLETTKLAMDNAKAKAEAITSHTGNSLGQIIEIKEYNPEITIYEKDARSLFSKSIILHGGGTRSIENDNIGIRKIRFTYIVDVKYELK